MGDPEFMKIISSRDEENTITFGDVNSLEKNNSYMIYDAYILYTDDPDDEEFAFEIKEELEKKNFCKVRLEKFETRGGRISGQLLFYF